jgi:hypothetical protein
VTVNCQVFVNFDCGRPDISRDVYIFGKLTSGGNAYHDRKATMNPNHEKKKTLP